MAVTLRVGVAESQIFVGVDSIGCHLPVKVSFENVRGQLTMTHSNPQIVAAVRRCVGQVVHVDSYRQASSTPRPSLTCPGNEVSLGLLIVQRVSAQSDDRERRNTMPKFKFPAHAHTLVTGPPPVVLVACTPDDVKKNENVATAASEGDLTSLNLFFSNF